MGGLEEQGPELNGTGYRRTAALRRNRPERRMFAAGWQACAEDTKVFETASLVCR